MPENKTVDIAPDSSHYSFTAHHSDARVKRFKIFTIPEEKDTLNVTANIRIFVSERTVFVTNRGKTAGSLSLYDISGRLVKTIPFGANCISSIQPFFPAGVYIVKATSSAFGLTERLIFH